MAIKFEKIQPGMTLYDRHSHRMGNTTMKTIGEWPVRIISVDAEKRGAMASWNGNPARWYSERDLRKLHTWSMRDDCAEVVTGVWGSVVKVTKKRRERAEEVGE